MSALVDADPVFELDPYADVVFSSESGILCSGEQGMVALDDISPGDLQVLLQAVDGRRRVSEICSLLAERYAAADVRSVLSSLEGIVLRRSRSNPGQPSGTRGAVARSTHLLVLGDGLLASTISHALREQGFSNIERCAGVALDGSACPDILEVARGERLAMEPDAGRRLSPQSGRVPTPSEAPSDTPSEVSPEALDAMLSRADLTICLLEGVRTRALLAVNAASLRSGTACIFVTPLRGELICGPTLVPWKSPCFECSRLTTGDASVLKRRLGPAWDAIAVPRMEDGASANLLARRAGAEVVREVVGFLTGSQHPSFLHELRRLHRDGSTSDEPHRPSTSCRQCRGLLPQGLIGPDTPSPSPIELENPPIRDRTSGYRVQSLAESRLHAERAVARLSIGLEMRSVPEQVCDRYPELRDLPYHHAQDTSLFASDAPALFVRRAQNHYGKGPTKAQAWCSAVFEWLERHLSQYRGGVDVVRAPYSAVKGRAIDIPDLTSTLIRHWDSRDRIPPQPEEPLDWVWGHDLKSGRPILLPAALVFLGGGDFLGSDRALPFRGSSGLAAGCTPEEALLQGLFEVVEHDAWYSAWRSGAYCPSIELDSVGDEVCRELIRLFRSAGFEIQARDLTNDIGIPVFETTLRSTRDRSAYQLPGFGAHLDPVIAMRRALTEVGQTLCSELGRSSWSDLLSSNMSPFNAATFVEVQQATKRVCGSRVFDEIEDRSPTGNGILDSVSQTVTRLAEAVPDADICLYDHSMPELPGVHVVNAFVTRVNDQVGHFSHIGSRLRRYRRIMEGPEAPLLEDDDLYLGTIQY